MMKTRFARVVALAAVVFLSLALGGCGTSKVPAGSVANTVTATGSGKVSATPDQAEMTFGVTRVTTNAQQALDMASKAAEQITAALVKGGVDKQDIQTQSLSVSPQMTIQGGRQVITGYQATVSVRTMVRNISKLGGLIEAANAAGSDQIDGPTLTLSDKTPYREKATGLAVTDARQSAEALAKAAGKKVGAVLSISSTESDEVPGPLFDAAAATAKGVPVEPGRIDVRSNVTLVFELK